MKVRYSNISIPEGLAKKIDKFLKETDLDFRSRAAVVNFVLRKFFVDMKTKK